MRSVARFGIACHYEEIRHAQSDPDNDRDKKSKIQISLVIRLSSSRGTSEIRKISLNDLWLATVAERSRDKPGPAQTKSNG
jgi:hypothetical protein